MSGFSHAARFWPNAYRSREAFTEHMAKHHAQHVIWKTPKTTKSTRTDQLRKNGGQHKAHAPTEYYLVPIMFLASLTGKESTAPALRVEDQDDGHHGQATSDPFSAATWAPYLRPFNPLAYQSLDAYIEHVRKNKAEHLDDHRHGQLEVTSDAVPTATWAPSLKPFNPMAYRSVEAYIDHVVKTSNNAIVPCEHQNDRHHGHSEATFNAASSATWAPYLKPFNPMAYRSLESYVDHVLSNDAATRIEHQNDIHHEPDAFSAAAWAPSLKPFNPMAYRSVEAYVDHVLKNNTATPHIEQQDGNDHGLLEPTSDAFSAENWAPYLKPFDPFAYRSIEAYLEHVIKTAA